ncbi:MAG: hypothetical protein Q8R60_04585 [Mycobacteriales bacterium]|nr:hypothetical protein [Mycobacteriales bacterium]
MNSNDEILSVVPTQDAPEIDELDDVEGHGLKEVVVGLSAAAVLGGGVASAASSIPPIGDDMKTPGAAAAVVQGAQDDVNTVTAPVAKQVDRTVASINSTTTKTVAGATTLAKGMVTTVDTLAADTITQAGAVVREVASDPASYATNATRPSVQKASNTVNRLGDRTIDLTVTTIKDATAAVDSALDGAFGTASSTLKVVTATADSATATTTDIVLGLQGSDVEAGAKAQSKDAWLVAKVGNEVVGSAQMDGGQWTVTIESRHLSSPITFSVGGQHDIPPMTVHLSR